MADEHDSWLKNALGVDIGKARQKIESAGSAAGRGLEDAGCGRQRGQGGIESRVGGVDGTKKAYGTVTDAYDKVAPNSPNRTRRSARGSTGSRKRQRRATRRRPRSTRRCPWSARS
jgi:hypothetical protein